MKIFDVLYYYYYLFYRDILREELPLFTTTYAFGFSVFLIITGIISVAIHEVFNYQLSTWFLIPLLIFILLFFSWHYHFKGKGKMILENKPQFLGSNLSSILITVAFFLLSFSLLFILPIYFRFINE